MQVSVDEKCGARRPNLDESIGFTIDVHGRLVCHPSHVSPSLCELLLRKGDQLHFDQLPYDLAERLRSCGVMTVEYVGDDYVVDIHDEQSQKFSLLPFADQKSQMLCKVSALQKSIFDVYSREDVLEFAAESGAD